MTGFREEPAAYSTGRMSKAAFLAWNQDREGPKAELKDGEIVMHPGSSIGHGKISHRIAMLLGALDDTLWEILSSDVAVEIADNVRYPDVIVARAPLDRRAYVVGEPIVIVEVLSPTSIRIDMVTKAREYLTLPSLDTYIVASQDEPIAWVWQRDGATQAFPGEPAEIAGRQALIELPTLGLSLPLSEIYRGIGAD